MVRTRNQLKLEEDEEIELVVVVSKYRKTDDEHEKALDESLAKSLAEIPPSTSKVSVANDNNTDSVPLLSLLKSLHLHGLSLPRIVKRLRKAVELVESDDVDGSLMMMIYLHNTNFDSEHFVDYVFTDPTFLEIARNHFILWAADMSKENEKAKIEDEIENELSIDVVELVRQYQRDHYPLILMVSLLNGQPQVLKLFTGVRDRDTLYQELKETLVTHRNLMAEQEESHSDGSEQLPLHQEPVRIQLQVGPFVHLAEFRPEQQLRDLLQYVAENTGLEIGQFSLSSFPGTDLTVLSDMDSLTLDMVGMKGGRKTTLNIAKK